MCVCVESIQNETGCVRFICINPIVIVTKSIQNVLPNNSIEYVCAQAFAVEENRRREKKKTSLIKSYSHSLSVTHQSTNEKRPKMSANCTKFFCRLMALSCVMHSHSKVWQRMNKKCTEKISKTKIKIVIYFGIGITKEASMESIRMKYFEMASNFTPTLLWKPLSFHGFSINFSNHSSLIFHNFEFQMWKTVESNQIRRRMLSKLLFGIQLWPGKSYSHFWTLAEWSILRTVYCSCYEPIVLHKKWPVGKKADRFIRRMWNLRCLIIYIAF